MKPAVCAGFLALRNYLTMYSGTSLIRSPMGLGKSDLNGEVTVLHVQYNMGLSKGDPNGEVALLVR